MADLIGGAALGAATGELLKAILDVIDKAVVFKSTLESLKNKLKSLQPYIEEIQKQNLILDRRKQETEELTEQIKRGKELVIKCSKLHRSKLHCLNFLKWAHYTKKLLELEGCINNYIQINMVTQLVRNTNEISIKMDKCVSLGENQTRLIASCAVPELPATVVGLDKPVKELKMELFKDKVSVLVLTASPGFGKTTLAKQFCQDIEVRGKFMDNVLFVTVGKKPNLKSIIKKLFEFYKGNQVPEFHSDDDAVNSLEQLLKDIAPNPLLLVLDDVWSGSMIEKFVFQISNYKILVTSRYVFPRFASTYHLRPLGCEDAMTLFRQSAFRQDGSSYTPDEDLVKEIVESCKGYPLVLTVIGRSLCGQPAGMWHNRVSEWSKGLSIFDSDSDLLDCLGTSLELDALDNKVLVKECFLDLGLFPEDQRIPASVLIDMGVELYELDEDGKGAISNLHLVSFRNLANLVVTRSDALCHANEVDGYYNEHFVTQHDVLRELSIHQSSLELIEKRKRLIIDINGNDFPKWWTSQKQSPVCARLLSISTDETFSSNWCDMQPPEVEVLILNFQTKNYTLPEFMEKMDKLKVLVVTNYGFFPAELSNFLLLGSLSSLKRIRLEKISIPPLCDTTIRLENLQKISLVMCNISNALRNCTPNIAGMLPKLVEIHIDCCNDLEELPAELCYILSLKKLSITNCHKLSALPEEIGKLENLEVLRLSSCSGLLDLQDSVRSLHKLRILDISNCVSIGKLPEQIGELHNLEKIYMSGRLKLIELPASVMDLVSLKHVICDEQRAILWKPFRQRFSNLRLEVLKEDFNLDWLF